MNPDNKESNSKRGSTASRRIATLSSIHQDSDHDDNDGADFFVGGSKGSGLVVQGGDSNDQDSSDFVQGAMRRMAQLASSQNSTGSNFTGPAYSLTNSGDASSADSEVVSREAIFYRNGFLIQGGAKSQRDNDSVFYPYSEPHNQELVQSILSGHVPHEIFNVRHGQKFDLHIIQRIEQDYLQTTQNIPFHGTGYRLGAVTNLSNVAPSSLAQSTLQLDSLNSQAPMTRLQIRLMDGTRIVGHFNMTHTIRDIYRFLDLNRPGASPVNSATLSRSYLLQVSVPSQRILNNMDQTIQESGLDKTTIIQRPLG
jgi:UBX domain-containing protein 1